MPDLDQLLKAARHLQVTPEDAERQRRSFAYGNANIENPKVTRTVIDHAAEDLRKIQD